MKTLIAAVVAVWLIPLPWIVYKDRWPWSGGPYRRRS